MGCQTRGTGMLLASADWMGATAPPCIHSNGLTGPAAWKKQNCPVCLRSLEKIWNCPMAEGA
jgi:hypothetical protein